MQFLIAGLQKTSLLDYPDKISAIVFTPGCNFRCGYCHNPGLLSRNSKNVVISNDEFFEFLSKRKGKLDGVVISGGEATLQPDLNLFIQKIKDMNFSVKLDTNGYNPEKVAGLIKNNLIDYVAMDIKAPVEKYSKITNVEIDESLIKESIDLIMNSCIDYEFRTTVLKSQLSFDDFDKIGKLIQGAERYFLQKFTVESEILDSSLVHETTYSDEEFMKIKEIMAKYVKQVQVR